MLEWFCRRLRSSVIIGELHLSAGGHLDTVNALTDYLSLKLCTSTAILSPFTRIRGLRLYEDAKIRLDDLWIRASLRKGMCSIDASDNRRTIGTAGLDAALDFCFGYRPGDTRNLVARFRWADEEAVLKRIVRVGFVSLCALGFENIRI